MKRLDEQDRQLARLLRANPEIATRKLSQELGISEKTATTRLAALSDQNYLKITAQWDMHSLGLDVAGNVYIHPGNKPLSEVAKAIAEIEEVQSVAEVAGWPALHALIVVENIRAFYAVADSLAAKVPGISLIETEIAAEIVKYRSDYGSLANTEHWSPSLETTPPRIKLDHHDISIANLLQHDARISNREVARQLNVSETMVRQRLKRLFEQSALHKAVVVNPFVFDYSTAILVRVRIGGGQAADFCALMSKREHAVAIMKVIGHYNVMLLMLGENLQTVTDEVYDCFSGFSEVGEYAISPIIKTYKHRYNLASL